MFDLVKNGFPGSLEASLAIAMSKLYPECRGEIVENSSLVCKRFDQASVTGNFERPDRWTTGVLFRLFGSEM